MLLKHKRGRMSIVLVCSFLITIDKGNDLRYGSRVKDNKHQTPVISTLEDYINEYVVALTNAILDGLNEQAELIGNDSCRQLAMTIVTSLVAAILYKELKIKVNGKKDRKEADAVLTHFNKVKGEMQSAVATGFELAMSKFSGKPIEYYCKVTPIDDKISSKAIN